MMVQFRSGDEKASAYLVKPDGKGPFPAMVVVHEWWGLNDWTKHMADKLAGEGYVAMAVDLYRGKSTANPDEAHQFMSGLPEDRAVRDLKGAFAYLQAQSDVKKDRIGSIGWCMGGKYSGLLAIEEPKLTACVIYYGSMPTDAETLKKIQAPVIGFFGGADQGVTPELARDFQHQMEALKKVITVTIYDGAGHGFANETGKNYNPDATRDAWEKTVAFLSKYLHG
jgi:carboxymethylenebutenolidase